MANTVKVKRSAVAGRVPTTTDIALGELAINTTDGKLYLKKSVGGVETIVDVTAAIGAGVLSFNTRTGAVTLTSGDVTTALGYTPVNKAGDTMTGELAINNALLSVNTNAGGTSAYFKGRASDNLTQFGFRTAGDAGWMGLLQFINGNMIWNTGNNASGLTESFRMDPSGYQILPIQPYCYVGQNGTISGSVVINFDTVYANRGGCYNPANGRFTAPAGGIYHITCHIGRLGTVNNNCAADGRVLVNGGVVSGFASYFGVHGTNSTETCSFFYPLAAGDYVQVTGSGYSIYKPFTGFPEFYTMSVRLCG
jgi:hypothetical protein